MAMIKPLFYRDINCLVILVVVFDGECRRGD